MNINIFGSDEFDFGKVEPGHEEQVLIVLGDVHVEVPVLGVVAQFGLLCVVAHPDHIIALILDALVLAVLHPVDRLVHAVVNTLGE